MDTRQSLTKLELPANLRLEFLTPEQVVRIDKVLATVGEYGEVHLIIQKGELRYINRVESYKAWNDKQK
jgi:hypothetical protein